MLRRLEDYSSVSLAVVIPIRPVEKSDHDPREKRVKEKAGKKLPLFYEEPIFKCKRHDFL